MNVVPLGGAVLGQRLPVRRGEDGGYHALGAFAHELRPTHNFAALAEFLPKLALTPSLNGFSSNDLTCI